LGYSCFLGARHEGLQRDLGAILVSSQSTEQILLSCSHSSHLTSQASTVIFLYDNAEYSNSLVVVAPLIHQSITHASTSSGQAFSAHTFSPSATVVPLSSQWHFLSFSGSSQDSNSHLVFFFLQPGATVPSGQLPVQILLSFSKVSTWNLVSCLSTLGLAL